MKGLVAIFLVIFLVVVGMMAAQALNQRGRSQNCRMQAGCGKLCQHKCKAKRRAVGVKR